MPLTWPLSRLGLRTARFLFAYASAALAVALSASGAPEETVVYRSGTEGYNTFRIPAIVRAPNGDLLAFAEGRKNSRSDSGDIDMVLKRSHDEGKTWGPVQILWDDSANTCGNPCPVVDAQTGTIWLLSTHNLGNDSEEAIHRSKGVGSRTVWLLHSNDNGATWSAAVDISASTKKPDWTWYATGPGIGIQITQGPHAGRLVIPSDHNYQDGTKSVHCCHVIFSDDHGKTWQIGGTIEPEMNECQVVELLDGQGTLLMDMRSYRGLAQRAESRSQDGGLTWTKPVDVPALVEPICQASILRWAKADGKSPGWILFSNPADPKKRRHLVVRTSEDDAQSWSRSLALDTGSVGYSCLIALGDSSAACFYERSEKRPYDSLVFTRFAPSDFKTP